MIVLPTGVKEYSTARTFVLDTRLAINPVDSRLRRVFVSMRRETLPSRRRSCPCRKGLSFSENKTFAVHLPMKIGVIIFVPCPDFMPFRLPRKLLGGSNLSFRPSFRARHRPTLPVLARQAQLGTHGYLGLFSCRWLITCDSYRAGSVILARSFRRPVRQICISQSAVLIAIVMTEPGHRET